MLVVLAALAAAAPPTLPDAYTATLTWGECGNEPPCTMPSDNRTTYTDGKTAMNHAVLTVPSLGSVKYHELWTSTGKQYRWDDGESDCSENAYPAPVQSDWAWLALETTVDGGVVPCPYDANAKCHLYSGPWPVQLTSLIQLWLVEQPNGPPTPVHLQMTCSVFPFTIYKNFTSVRWGAPPPGALAADASCKNATSAATAVPALPRTREEALATGRAGPYTSMLRRALLASKSAAGL